MLDHERRLLRVADASFDLPFAIGIADTAREGLDNQLTIRFACAGTRRARGRGVAKSADAPPQMAGFASPESVESLDGRASA
jgi:hypothetical protein